VGRHKKETIHCPRRRQTRLDLPQEQVRTREKKGSKKTTKKKVNAATAGIVDPTYRGFHIAGGGNLLGHGIAGYPDVMTLQTVTRNLTEKLKTDSILCVGTASTSFHACMGGQDRILALTGIVLDNNSPKKMWFCFTHAPLPLEAKSKYTSVWVVANMLPKAWVWTDVHVSLSPRVPWAFCCQTQPT
jgi:hypothetical protein